MEHGKSKYRVDKPLQCSQWYRKSSFHHERCRDSYIPELTWFIALILLVLAPAYRLFINPNSQRTIVNELLVVLLPVGCFVTRFRHRAMAVVDVADQIVGS